MNFKFTLVINAGRSGSTFLYALLKQNVGSEVYIGHEDIPVQVSKPKVYNRKYKSEDLDMLKKDPILMEYVYKWQTELKNRHVIETGWTAYHLAPLLKDVFKDKFQIIILHRDPISFAFSRANMGNYHKNTFYTNHHEVSPFDQDSIAPFYKNQWSSMNHFEKCMFWWYTVYKEAFEFKSKFSEVPSLVITSKNLFNVSKFGEVLEFLQLVQSKPLIKDVPRNELAQFMRETFPVHKEWENYKKHEDILNFAKDLGYTFNHAQIADLSKKYVLPNGVLPLIRNKTQYWKMKSKLRYLLKI